MDEAAASGKVVRFTAPVVNQQGQENQREVTRIGNFIVLADGHYLRYLESSRQTR
ncbi:MAG: hypothetical protein U5P41_13160 [Gammaproteobacteria bacterium]|nr:hypothetical protein [Gammaproteobacteria bacterium]